MYAVIKAGGKQQRVKPGDVIEVELMHGLHGESVTFSPLLVVDDDGKAHVGKDLGRATVKAKLVGQQKGDKVKVFKYRPKTGYKKTQGHRQMYTLVEIEDVSLGRRAAPKKEADGEKPKPESGRPAPEAEIEGATGSPPAESGGAEASENETPAEPTETVSPQHEGVSSVGVGAGAEAASPTEEGRPNPPMDGDRSGIQAG